jgi:pilus assembly protein CpaD
MNYIIKNMLPVMVICVFLAGCNGVSNDIRHAKTYEQRHPILVETQQNNIEIPINLNESDLSPIDEAKIKSFLYQYNQQNNKHLVITVPESGLKVSAAKSAVKNIVAIANNIGIQQESIRIGTYKPLNDTVGGVRMSFESVVAKKPDCSNNWSKNLADAYNNEIHKGHGCATRKNLAAMIVYPQDLVRMRDLGIGNSARRVGVFDKYIAGQSTGASKDSSETAQSTR